MPEPEEGLRVGQSADAAHVFLLQGLFRVDSIYHHVREYFAIIGRGAPRDRLYRSVDDYVKRTPKQIAALKHEVEAPQYAREATRAEAFDATVCR